MSYLIFYAAIFPSINGNNADLTEFTFFKEDNDYKVLILAFHEVQGMQILGKPSLSLSITTYY